MMKKLHGLFIVCALISNPVFASECVVPPELWEKPRSGSILLMQKSLRSCVVPYLAEPGAKLVIRHPGDEEGQLRAEELRGWLVALAIESVRVSLASDLNLKQHLTVELILPPVAKSINEQEETKQEEIK